MLDIADKNLAVLRRHDEIWRLLDWKCTNSIEIEENLNFGFCSNSTINLLVSRSDIPEMRCFSIGGMKNQQDAILKTFSTTEEIINLLTRSPSTI